MEIRDIRSTDLFAGTEQRPLQLLSATLVNRGVWMARGQQPVTVRAEGPGVTTPEPAVVPGPAPGETITVEVPVSVDPGYAEGTSRRVTVIAEAMGRSARAGGELVVAGTGWTMFMVPHFHYDPVWWNTQAGYAATWDDLPAAAQERRASGQHAVFHLVRAHLDAARRDPDYKFVLAELDYLKPYWDTRPEDRAEIAELISAGRIELVGGMYNEPNTNLTSLEGTIRNTIYGVSYQRGVLGGDPRTGWMLDVFGHDPSYPAVMADAGLTSSSWARGPFHQWGPRLTVGDSTRMQFPSEFEWIAPDGRGLLTSYMANHYSAGWQLSTPDTLAEAEAEALALFHDLKTVAATRNVLLPVGADHVIPSRWATEIQRDWNKRYLWPRFMVGLPAEFFAAVRADAARRRVWFTPQSRDMNPVYTGKDVSYIDTKQAHRAAETALADAEKLATLASLFGAGYPGAAIDKAWRQLCFNAHHDGITGTESDQVYLDLLGGWREAWELAAAARDTAISNLAEHVDTRGEGRPVLVVNTQSWPRTDVTSVTARFPEPGPAGAEIRDADGRQVPAVLTAAGRHPDGTLAEATLSFVATGVPATGYRIYRLCGTAGPGTGGWQPAAGTRAESGTFLAEADPGRGGALTRILDKRTGKDLVPSGAVANELVCHDEYPDHPEFGEGPWHLLPNGTARGTSAARAAVRAEVSAAGQRLIATCQLGGLTVTQEATCWEGLDRLEFRTHVDGSIGHDRLLRARFPLDVAGARPVYEVGNAVIGRTFGFPGADAAAHPWTLDNPAGNWAGLSSTVRVAFAGADGTRRSHAVGVAEIVADGPAARVRDLVAALAQQGVTATTSRPDGPRYGALDVDSNLPDVRLSIGGPEQNAFTARVLESADGRYASWLARQLADTGQARVWVPAARGRAATWVPGADLRGPRDLPVLIVTGRDTASTAAAVADLAGDLGDATIDVATGATPDGEPDAGIDGTGEPAEGYSAALLNRGTPGAVIEPSGTVHLSLMRSCSGWPSGIWMDPPRRSAPDGSSFAWQHWSHTFEYALACGTGDWRDAGFVHAGHAYNHPLQAHVAAAHDGELPPSVSLLEVEPAQVVLTALKPRGNPPAADGTGDRTGGRPGLIFRCYETNGRPARARIRCAVPVRDGALASILEEPQAPLDTSGGTLELDVPPTATVTATAVPAARPADGPGSSGGPDSAQGPDREPAEPVFARYWLHNKGAAPIGCQAVTVRVEPRAAELTGETSMRVTVAATRSAAGSVELMTPPGLRATVPDGGLRYDLSAGGYQRFDVPVRSASDAEPGTYHVAVRITGDGPGTVEDVAAVGVGQPGGPAADLAVTVDPPELNLPPGGTATLRARLTSHCRDDVRGEAQLISPFGTWELAAPWARGFVLPSGGQATLAFSIRIPPGARPMATWLLVKVMAYGRVYYTAPVALTVSPPAAPDPPA